MNLNKVYFEEKKFKLSNCFLSKIQFDDEYTRKKPLMIDQCATKKFYEKFFLYKNLQTHFNNNFHICNLWNKVFTHKYNFLALYVKSLIFFWKMQ